MPEPSKPRPRSNTRKDAPTATEPETTSASAASPRPREPDPGPIEADNLDEAFVKALETDFILHGAKAIAAMRADKPADYVKIVATLRAKDASDASEPLRQMSDAELDRRLDEAAKHAGYEIRRAALPRRNGTTGDEGADAD
jgi:hypothetical protein